MKVVHGMDFVIYGERVMEIEVPMKSAVMFINT